MKLKRNLLLIFCLLAGIVVGAMIAQVCAGVPFLRWLSYGGTIGFNTGNPFVLDLLVLQLTFGFSLSVTVAQIITIGLSIFIYNRIKLR